MSNISLLFLLSLALSSCFSAEATGITKRRSHSHKAALHGKLHVDPAHKDAEDQDEDQEDADELDVLNTAINSAKTALDKNLKEEKLWEAKLDHLEDKKASDMEIDNRVKVVAKETESKSLANMLGDMWKEQRMLEVPSYADHIKKAIENDKKMMPKLKANLEKAKAELKATKDEWAAEDKQEDAQQAEMRRQRKDQKKLTQMVVAKGAPKVEAPALKTPKIFPVPTTSRCIVIMVCQYMIIYTALALVRTYHEFSGTAKGKAEAGLRAAAQTLTYGPMLCVLFIACRMRVEFLSDGTDQPQNWVQQCMYALTFAVLASTLLVLFMPLITGKPIALKEGTCDLEKPESEPGTSTTCSKIGFFAFSVARYLILLGLYGGLAGVIYGICTYLPPGATDLNKLPPPAPAVMCTMILAVLFFATQLIIAVCRSYAEFTGVEFPKIVGLMNAAANTVEFAPQLAILFLAARMRALQHDAQPQHWAQQCMFAATYALCCTAVLACAVPVVMGGSMKTNPVTKEVTFEVPNQALGYVLVGVRFVCMLGFYGGAVGVAYSIFTFQAPKSWGDTLPVSPTVHCVVNLTCQFFFVYLLQTVMLTVSEVTAGRIPLEKYKFFAAVEAAKSTLAFAPMLSILFVTTRMYALLITDKKGAPQAWVQDGMYMATWSLLISFLACMATGLILDKVETDEDGNVVNKFSNKYVGTAMLVVRYMSMLLLYGGICMVVVGLFVMTPETANGRGSVPVVSDVVGAPPGPQDVADAVAQASDSVSDIGQD